MSERRVRVPPGSTPETAFASLCGVFKPDSDSGEQLIRGYNNTPYTTPGRVTLPLLITLIDIIKQAMFAIITNPLMRVRHESVHACPPLLYRLAIRPGIKLRKQCRTSISKRSGLLRCSTENLRKSVSQST